MSSAVRGGWTRDQGVAAGPGAGAGAGPAGAALAAAARRLRPVQPRTMVEQAAEAIVAAAARGVFLPGDRLVEAEIARDLGISRVPVREALRLLESQGVVVSTPYKGMRLMQVTNAAVAELMRVRLALEALAVRDAIAASAAPGGLGARRFAALRAAAEAYAAEAAPGGDPAQVAVADAAFHGELCRASGNGPLAAVWQGLARQLAVVWGLVQPLNDAAAAARQHAALAAALEAGDAEAAAAVLGAHIAWYGGCDVEALIRARRARG